MDNFALIEKYHVQMPAYFAGKLASSPDGDGTLFLSRLDKLNVDQDSFGDSTGKLEI